MTAARNPLRLPEAPDPAPGSVHARLVAAAADADVLFHGSNARTIEVFEPRPQMTAYDLPVTAVFATPDPLWAMFFAVTDTVRAVGRWNMCLLPVQSGLTRPRYYFAVRGDPRTVWTRGAVYVLPKETFVPSDIPAEWISHEPVRPLDVITVGRDDFPFADRVFRFSHPEPESVRLARLIRSRWIG